MTHFSFEKESFFVSACKQQQLACRLDITDPKKIIIVWDKML